MGFAKLITKTYLIEIKTADEMMAGTDANVTLCMSGTKGDTGNTAIIITFFESPKIRFSGFCHLINSGERKLTKSILNFNKWEKGQTDLCEFVFADLGEIEFVTIGLCHQLGNSKFVS